MASSNFETSVSSNYPVQRSSEVSYAMQSGDKPEYDLNRRRDAVRDPEEGEDEAFEGSQRHQTCPSHEHPRDHVTDEEIDQSMLPFKPYLPAWLQRAVKDTRRETLAQEVNLGIASHPGTFAAHTRHDQVPLPPSTVGEIFDDHQRNTSVHGFSNDRRDSRQRQPVDMFTRPSFGEGSTSIRDGNFTPVLGSSMSSAIQPFATPGPHAARQARIENDKRNHDRYLPSSFRAASPSPLTRHRSITPIGLVSIEPIGLAKPFSTPFIRTQEELSLPDKYSGNGKRDLYARTIISLPTIAEELGETPYSSMSVQDDGFSMPQGDGNLDVNRGEYQEPELVFAQECTDPMRPTSPDYSTDQIAEELSPEMQLPSSTGPFFDQSFEMVSDPKSYHHEDRDEYEPFPTRTLHWEVTTDVDLYGSGLDRSLSRQEDTQQVYYFSEDDGGGQECDLMYHLEGPTSTAIMDVDALEAAAAAASEESLTAIGAFVEDTKGAEGPKLWMIERSHTGRKQPVSAWVKTCATACVKTLPFRRPSRQRTLNISPVCKKQTPYSP